MTMQVTDTIEDCLDRIRLAWNAADAAAYAREFTEDATYVIFLGDALMGRARIEETHVDVLNKWQRGTRMLISPVAITMLGDTVASVLTIGGIGKDEPGEFDKFQTLTLVQRAGRWQCAAFQNTEMSERAIGAYNAPAST